MTWHTYGLYRYVRYGGKVYDTVGYRYIRACEWGMEVSSDGAEWRAAKPIPEPVDTKGFAISILSAMPTVEQPT